MPVHLPSVGVHSQEDHFVHGQSGSLKPLDPEMSPWTRWEATTLRESKCVEEGFCTGREVEHQTADPPLLCFSSAPGPWAAMDVRLKTLRAPEDTR